MLYFCTDGAEPLPQGAELIPFGSPYAKAETSKASEVVH